MSVRTLAVLLIRLVALWVFINGISSLAALFQPAEEEYARHALRLAVLVGSLLPIAIAFIVWSNADWLGARATRDLGDEEGGLPWLSPDFTRAAVAIVGVVVLTQSLPEMAWYGSLFMSLSATKSSVLGPVSVPEDVQMQYWNIGGKANFAAAGARLLVGLACLLKPGAVAGLVGKADAKARPEDEDETPETSGDVGA